MSHYKVKKAPCIAHVRILLMRLEHPELTLRAIGTRVGRTGEDVRYTLKSYRLPTRSIRQARAEVHCTKCGNVCLGKYCKKCYYEMHHIQLVCTTCGVTFPRRLSNYTSRMTHRRAYPALPQYSGERFFHNKKCFSGWVGKTHGKGRTSTS